MKPRHEERGAAARRAGQHAASRSGQRQLRFAVTLILGVLAVWIIAADPLVLYGRGGGPNDAERSLHFAVPILSEPGTADRFDAARLSELRHAEHLRRLTYLPSSHPSTRSDEVSVWAVDASTWAGAARVEGGDCFVMVAEFGDGLGIDRRLFKSAKGIECSARKAVPRWLPDAGG